MARCITLEEWGDKNFSVQQSLNTLRKWAREGKLNPPPEKRGKSWWVHPNAVYVQKTIEAQRTEQAQKELDNLPPSNIVLSTKLLRIVNNDTKAA
jgi:hypothetical protein